MIVKHTQGPWTTSDDHPDGAIPVRADGLLVAVCRYSQNPRIGKENAEANARLIAAAPELLEALKLALSSRSVIHMDDQPKLQAAIAKATGG